MWERTENVLLRKERQKKPSSAKCWIHSHACSQSRPPRGLPLNNQGQKQVGQRKSLGTNYTVIWIYPNLHVSWHKARASPYKRKYCCPSFQLVHICLHDSSVSCAKWLRWEIYTSSPCPVYVSWWQLYSHCTNGIVPRLALLSWLFFYNGNWFIRQLLPFSCKFILVPLADLSYHC